MLTIASNFAFLLLLVFIVLVGFDFLVDLTWDLLTEERSMRYCDRLQSFWLLGKCFMVFAIMMVKLDFHVLVTYCVFEYIIFAKLSWDLSPYFVRFYIMSEVCVL